MADLQRHRAAAAATVHPNARFPTPQQHARAADDDSTPQAKGPNLELARTPVHDHNNVDSRKIAAPQPFTSTTPFPSQAPSTPPTTTRPLKTTPTRSTRVSYTRSMCVHSDRTLSDNQFDPLNTLLLLCTALGRGAATARSTVFGREETAGTRPQLDQSSTRTRS